MSITIEKEKCKGCNYCISVCPEKAISLSGKLNKHGYEYVLIDEELCIRCGMCYTICPDNVFEFDEKH